MQRIVCEFLTLSVFLFFMGFCFCDGFKLHVVRKIIWFVGFLITVLVVFQRTQAFDLVSILPFPLILALILCWYEKRIHSSNRGGKQ